MDAPKAHKMKYTRYTLV